MKTTIHDKSDAGTNVHCTGETQLAYFVERIDYGLAGNADAVFDAFVMPQRVSFTTKSQADAFCALLDSMAKDERFQYMDVGTEATR